MHDIVIVGVPLIAILAGVLFNRSDSSNIRGEIAALRTEVNGLRTEVNGRFSHLEHYLSQISADLRHFYHLTGKLEARMDSLEKQ